MLNMPKKPLQFNTAPNWGFAPVEQLPGKIEKKMALHFFCAEDCIDYDLTPEQKLLLAMLMIAVGDVLGDDITQHNSAKEWFLPDEEDNNNGWGSFEYICNELHLGVGTIQRLKKLAREGQVLQAVLRRTSLISTRAR